MSEHESNSSDDEKHVHQVSPAKKLKHNSIYQRASRPIEYDEDDDNDDDDDDAFNRQIRLEQTKTLQDKAEHAKTKVDPDGTVYEWDSTVKGW